MIRTDNELLETLRENHSNSERRNAWRYRSLLALNHWPDGDIQAWRRAAWVHDVALWEARNPFVLAGRRAARKEALASAAWLVVLFLLVFGAFYMASAEADHRVSPIEIPAYTPPDC